MKGKVYLVGAGPGDEGLITVRGADLLQRARVVVYDSLIGEGIKKYINTNAQMIYVGKRAGNHSKTQEEINNILVEEGLRGGCVVRLKGGDPFLFGRGGEELAALNEKGILYEVVPGVTSAIGAAAYGGIPVTHRGLSSSLHIITGHLRDGKYNIDFNSLAKLTGTLVFLMGISSLETITSSLITGGMDSNTPCGIVESGTTSKQRVTLGTLNNIGEISRSLEVKSPGIIIVGKVANLCKEYGWVHNKPLFGTKILVTRPKTMASKLGDKLYEVGAEVSCIDTIVTDKIDRKGFLSAMDNIHKYKWIILTSQVGVREFFTNIRESRIDIRSLNGIKFAAVGPSTKREIENMGILVDFVPSVYDGKTLGNEIGDIESCVLFRAAIGNEEIIEILESRGVKCLDVPIYDTKHVLQNINPDNYDYITFTSKSCVDGFVASTSLDDYTGINAICIGETTGNAAKAYGMRVSISEEATLDSMVKLLEKIRRG